MTAHGAARTHDSAWRSARAPPPGGAAPLCPCAGDDITPRHGPHARGGTQVPVAPLHGPPSMGSSLRSLASCGSKSRHARPQPTLAPPAATLDRPSRPPALGWPLRPRTPTAGHGLPGRLQRALPPALLTVGVDATQQVLVQAHLVERVEGLLPVGVKLVLVALQAAGRQGQGERGRGGKEAVQPGWLVWVAAGTPHGGLRAPKTHLLSPRSVGEVAPPSNKEVSTALTSSASSGRTPCHRTRCSE